jgi:hypothetical protein
VKRFIFFLLLASGIVGCATPPLFSSPRGHLTEMECRLNGGEPTDCGLLPEYGFGDWGNSWSEGLASNRRETPAISGATP